MQGASLVSSQYCSEFFTPEPQQDEAPPGLLEHPEPPHVPQLVEQQTISFALIPGISPPAVGHVWPIRQKKRIAGIQKGDVRSEHGGEGTPISNFSGEEPSRGLLSYVDDP